MPIIWMGNETPKNTHTHNTHIHTYLICRHRMYRQHPHTPHRCPKTTQRCCCVLTLDQPQLYSTRTMSSQQPGSCVRRSLTKCCPMHGVYCVQHTLGGWWVCRWWVGGVGGWRAGGGGGAWGGYFLHDRHTAHMPWCGWGRMCTWTRVWVFVGWWSMYTQGHHSAYHWPHTIHQPTITIPRDHHHTPPSSSPYTMHRHYTPSPHTSLYPIPHHHHTPCTIIIIHTNIPSVLTKCIDCK